MQWIRHCIPKGSVWEVIVSCPAYDPENLQIHLASATKARLVYFPHLLNESIKCSCKFLLVVACHSLVETERSWDYSFIQQIFTEHQVDASYPLSVGYLL
jgi:hypothetical protein